MNKELPINTDILKWARCTIGLSINDVASKMKKAADVIIDWESGKDSPTYPQLEKLAYKIYKRPIAVFFFPNIPEEDTPKTEFRALPELIIERLPIEIIKMYRKAKIFQHNLVELFENERPFKTNLVDKYSLSGLRDVIPIANKIRKDIGFSIENQFTWRNTDIAFKKWREAIENKGVFIFKDAFKNDDYSGFCVYDDDYPIIFINNSMPDSRQIFTLFHEIGHLLFHLGGIDFRDNQILDRFERKYMQYERVCNKFAGEFLVPTEIFLMQDLAAKESNIVNLANKFSVSREVILRKFLDNEKISDQFYKKMALKWAKETEDTRKKRKAKKDSKGHYYYTKISYLGNTYIDIVYKKYYQNKISTESLSGYLDIKERNIPAFEHYAFG